MRYFIIAILLGVLLAPTVAHASGPYGESWYYAGHYDDVAADNDAIVASAVAPYGVSVWQALCVENHESTNRLHIVSPTDDYGPFQVHLEDDGTFGWYSVSRWAQYSPSNLWAAASAFAERVARGEGWRWSADWRYCGTF